MFDETILSTIDQIRSDELFAEMSTLWALSDCYDKAMNLIQECDNINIRDYGIFSESFIMEAEVGNNVEGGAQPAAQPAQPAAKPAAQPQQSKFAAALETAKGKEGENIIWRIIAFIPRLIGAFISNLVNTGNDSKKIADELSKRLDDLEALARSQAEKSQPEETPADVIHIGVDKNKNGCFTISDWPIDSKEIDFIAKAAKGAWDNLKAGKRMTPFFAGNDRLTQLPTIHAEYTIDATGQIVYQEGLFKKNEPAEDAASASQAAGNATAVKNIGHYTGLYLASSLEAQRAAIDKELRENGTLTKGQRAALWLKRPIFLKELPQFFRDFVWQEDSARALKELDRIRQEMLRFVDELKKGGSSAVELAKDDLILFKNWIMNVTKVIYAKANTINRAGFKIIQKLRNIGHGANRNLGAAEKGNFDNIKHGIDDFETKHSGLDNDLKNWGNQIEAGLNK